MILNETYTLHNGVEIPKLGLGTWEIADENAAQAVRDAVAAGYRHIDTAWGYGNEKGVGEGIRTCGLPREQIFVTTKLHADFKTYESAKRGIEESLASLDIGYLDMLLIHAPQPWSEFREGDHYFEDNLMVWRLMEEYYRDGRIRAIGVSNFEKEDLENLIANAEVRPMVNQVLCHISNTPAQVIEYSQSQGILVEAYSPIGHGAMLRNAGVRGIADKYGISVPQLCIRYCLQLGLLPLPKTANPEHMKNNADVDGVVISDEDMELLRKVPTITNYGDAALYPVFGGKMSEDGSCEARDFVKRD